MLEFEIEKINRRHQPAKNFEKRELNKIFTYLPNEIIFRKLFLLYVKARHITVHAKNNNSLQ
jgi:hypothetical protein